MNHEEIKRRLLANIKEELGPLDTPCWIWLGAITSAGYGNIRYNGKSWQSHRLSYMAFVGPIPEEKPQINHHCHRRDCVNYLHLYAGTHQDNMDDKVAADRQAKGETISRGVLTEAEVIEARRMREEGFSCSEIAEEFGCGVQTISQATRGYCWKHIPGAVQTIKHRYFGVYPEGSKWRAQLRINGKNKHLGSFLFLWDAIICANYNRAYLDLPIIDYTSDPSVRLLAEGFPVSPHD